MKSVSELAKELNISPQAIYKKINNQLKNELSTHINKGLKGKTLIDQEGEKIIKASLNQSFQPVNEPSSQPVEDQVKVNFTQYNSLVKLLEEQLKVKDEQIQELLKQNESLIKKIENMQILLKNEQEKNVLLITQEQEQREKTEKPTIWKKIFTDRRK